MAQYEIVLKPSVQKDLRGLPRAVTSRIWERIEALQNDPFPRQSTKLADAENLHRLRVGDYRVIYSVDTAAGKVVILYVRHRRDVYRSI